VCFYEYNYTIIVLQRKSLSGYEYVNEKARIEFWSRPAYEDGDLLWNLECCAERCVKE
jgi:hypothetical protein